MWAASAARSLLISGSSFILRKIGARKKIGTDHLEAIASRFISSEHQACCFEGLLDHRKLALVQLEIGDLLRLGLFPCQLSFNRTFESFFRHPLRLVQPGCTIEWVPIPPATSTSSVALLQPTCCRSCGTPLFAVTRPPRESSQQVRRFPLIQQINHLHQSSFPSLVKQIAAPIPSGRVLHQPSCHGVCMHLKQFVLILHR